jgi:hypothetical protein
VLLPFTGVYVGLHADAEENPIFPTSVLSSLFFVQIRTGTADVIERATLDGPLAIFGLNKDDDGVAGGHQHSLVLGECYFGEAPENALPLGVVGWFGLYRTAARCGGGLDVGDAFAVANGVVHLVETANLQ